MLSLLLLMLLLQLKGEKTKFKKEGKKNLTAGVFQTTKRRYVSQADNGQLLYYFNHDFSFLKNHTQFSSVIEKDNDVVRDLSKGSHLGSFTRKLHRHLIVGTS